MAWVSIRRVSRLLSTFSCPARPQPVSAACECDIALSRSETLLVLGERHYCLLDGHCTMHVLTTVPCADRPPIRVCPQALSFFRKCRPSATRTRSPDPSSSADHHRDSSTPFAAAACPVATVCWCHIYLKASRASSSSSRVLRSDPPPLFASFAEMAALDTGASGG